MLLGQKERELWWLREELRMATIRITVKDENDETHNYEESIPLLEKVADDREYHDGLVHTIACGLLFRSDWCPDSLHDVVITVDGRVIDFYSHHGPGCL